MAHDPTPAILTHTAELCANVLSAMENNMVHHITSNVTVGEYTVTITLTKQANQVEPVGARQVEGMQAYTAAPSVLRKRTFSNMKHDTMMDERQVHPRYMHDVHLYNTYGHNFGSDAYQSMYS